jgi:hypothetical protein
VQVVRDFLLLSPEQRKSYGVSPKLEPGIIPYSYLWKRLKQYPAFSEHPRGGKAAMEIALGVAHEAEMVCELPTGVMQKTSSGRQIGKCFIIGRNFAG